MIYQGTVYTPCKKKVYARMANVLIFLEVFVKSVSNFSADIFDQLA